MSYELRDGKLNSHRLYHPAICWLICACLLAQFGCGPPIIGEFALAERTAAQQNKELFIFFKSWLSSECGDMQKLLHSRRTGIIQQKLVDKVLCILDQNYEPNQRFVAQYGIDSYPSVVLVHRDGTYHSHSGQMTADEIISFLDRTKAPGHPPRTNPQIPRSVDYHWEINYRTAFKLAKEQNRRLFIFYKSVISSDCNEVLWNVLNRPDVAKCFNDSVNCRLDWGHPPNRKLMAQYGVTNVPGFLIINLDGSYRTRQGRLTAEALISFARR